MKKKALSLPLNPNGPKRAFGRVIGPPTRKPHLYNLFYRKYFLDELYQNIIVKKILLGGIFAGLQKVDSYGVDGIVNGAAKTTAATGRAVRQSQTGQVQAYAMVIGLGIIAIVLVILFLG